MSTNLVVGLDIDGVLRDFNASLDKVYRREYPSHVVPEITQWDLHHFFPIGDEIYRFAFEQCGHEILFDAPAYPGAQWFVEQVLLRNHRIVFVTTQPPNLRHTTLLWLNKHGLGEHQICFLSDKSLARVDILLDDHIKNLLSALGDTLPVAFVRPWNQDWKGEQVSCYSEFLYGLDSDQYLEALEKRKTDI